MGLSVNTRNLGRSAKPGGARVATTDRPDSRCTAADSRPSDDTSCGPSKTATALSYRYWG
jgi:hypothetical protein